MVEGQPHAFGKKEAAIATGAIGLLAIMAGFAIAHADAGPVHDMFVPHTSQPNMPTWDQFEHDFQQHLHKGFLPGDNADFPRYIVPHPHIGGEHTYIDPKFIDFPHFHKVGDWFVKTDPAQLGLQFLYK